MQSENGDAAVVHDGTYRRIAARKAAHKQALCKYGIIHDTEKRASGIYESKSDKKNVLQGSGCRFH